MGNGLNRDCKENGADAMKFKKKATNQATDTQQVKTSKLRTRSRKKPTLVLHYDEDGKLLSGVGPGVGETFVRTYFPEANRVIRIASAYFTLTGHKLAQPHIKPNVQIHLLVGDEEGWHVRMTVIDEILADLGQCTTDIWSAVHDLVERMRQGRFIVRDAREMETPFHAKFYVCDESFFWHGSTNYSKRGLTVAAEQASIIRDSVQIKKFIDWYNAVAQDARDLLAELLERLEAWLTLASPFDIYLKTLLLLNDMPSYFVHGDAHMPTYFQKGVIAQALRQIETFGGALIVAATGLGKTVIGADIALRLYKEGTIKRVLLFAPQSVHDNWAKECDGRDFHPKMFDISIPFQPSSKIAHHQVRQLEQALGRADSNLLIIIDEAHYYRNQLLTERSKKSKSRVYERFVTAVKNGAKIVLLTATAYGTNMQNLNSLLHLLPHQNIDMLGATIQWVSNDTDTFAELPVVSILGLPHVIRMARERGDLDATGRVFIQIVGGKRYLPKMIKLRAIRYRLFLQAELQKAFDHHYFDQHKLVPQLWYDEEAGDYQTSMTDAVYNTSLRSWLSSPHDMQTTIKKNIATLDRINPNPWQDTLPSIFEELSENELADELYTSTNSDQTYNSTMRLAQGKRKAQLTPLLNRIEQLTTDDDDKFLRLKTIIEEHCLGANDKVLIFVGRLFTACYLMNRLEQLFRQQLNIGCTVDPGKSQPQLKNVKQRAEVLKTFSPRSHDCVPAKEYDILICTDADGVGVNLQDANILVHYDPPVGADTLFQRVGRILRMTSSADRILHIYTLVPSFVDQKTNRSRVYQDVYNIFDRMTRRHDTSQRILGAGILSKEGYAEITLDSESDIVQLARDSELLSDVGGIGVESRLRHIATLEQHHEYAVQIPDYLQSARGSTQQHSQMFVLLKYESKYYPVIYNLAKQNIEPLKDFEVLDRISCKETEPRAAVPADAIEHFANRAIQTWCEHEGIAIEQVHKICAMCLVPQGKADEVANLFKDALRLEKIL